MTDAVNDECLVLDGSDGSMLCSFSKSCLGHTGRSLMVVVNQL